MDMQWLPKFWSHGKRLCVTKTKTKTKHMCYSPQDDITAQQTESFSVSPWTGKASYSTFLRRKKACKPTPILPSNVYALTRIIIAADYLAANCQTQGTLILQPGLERFESGSRIFVMSPARNVSLDAESAVNAETGMIRRDKIELWQSVAYILQYIVHRYQTDNAVDMKCR